MQLDSLDGNAVKSKCYYIPMITSSEKKTWFEYLFHESNETLYFEHGDKIYWREDADWCNKSINIVLPATVQD